MPRIFPSNGAVDIEHLNDYEPYTVQLQAIGWSQGSPQYGGEQRLELTWEIDGREGETLKDWLSLRLGKQQNGNVSRLRALLNALAARPELTEISFFDTDTMEWGYDGPQGPAAARLSEGAQVVVRGKRVLKQDNSGYRFQIEVYQTTASAPGGSGAAPAVAYDRAAGVGAAAPSASLAAVVTAAADDNAIPF